MGAINPHLNTALSAETRQVINDQLGPAIRPFMERRRAQIGPILSRRGPWESDALALASRHFILACTICLAATMTSQATGRAATAPSSGFNDWSCRPASGSSRPRRAAAKDSAATARVLSPPGRGCPPRRVLRCTSHSQARPFRRAGRRAHADPAVRHRDRRLHRPGPRRHRHREGRSCGRSEGEFQALYGPKFVPGEAASVGRVVALAPPTHGTTLASLVTAGRRPRRQPGSGRHHHRRLSRVLREMTARAAAWSPR